MTRRRTTAGACGTGRAIAPLAVPVPGTMITMYVDRQDVGSGYRRFLVLCAGRKWVHLFHVPSLSYLKIGIGPRGVRVSEWTEAKPVASSYDPATMRGIIANNTAAYDRNRLQYSTIRAKQALKLLGG